MHTPLQTHREGVVDDDLHVGDVEPARRHVRGDEEGDLLRLEAVHRLDPVLFVRVLVFVLWVGWLLMDGWFS